MLVATRLEKVAWWQNPALPPLTSDRPPATAGHPLAISQLHSDATTAKILCFQAILDGCRLARCALSGIVRAAKRGGRLTMNQLMNTETLVHPERPVETAGNTAPDLSPPAKKRILLADDSPQIRESLSKVLRNAGYHVTLVAQGGQALDRALEETFDLLLLDLNMPGMDGWETLDHLAKLKPTLPVVIITAQPDQGNWARTEGACALMEKPLDLPLLLETIRELTGRSRSKAIASRTAAPTQFHFTAPEKQKFSFAASSHRWQIN
jgi:CheY-like chemotaxis protein